MSLDSIHKKLLNACMQIRFTKDLDYHFIYQTICNLKTSSFGLSENEMANYQSNESQLLQEPQTFSFLLSFLTRQKCESFCEIGVFAGWSLVLICSALLKSNPKISVVGLDLFRQPNEQIYEILNILGVKYNHISDNSFALKEYPPFDITHIDGDHSYEWVSNDWNNVGAKSKICFLHDVNFEGPGKLFDEIENFKIKIGFHAIYGLVINY